jgi:acetyl-CoA synthetase
MWTSTTGRGKPVGVGETGEIVIHTDEQTPCGLFSGYYNDEKEHGKRWHDGVYTPATRPAG